ncbi:MAG: YdcF family protein [Eubacteriales bacterium]|jgi:uncharacterized SAM-binding protein YcdF (DUF218 family)
MYLSKVDVKDFQNLSIDEITRIVYGGVEEYDGKSDLVLLLGGRPVECEPRADKAAKIYHEGKTRFIMPTGGVLWDSPLGHLSEADQMSIYLVRRGVPEEAIIKENQATTTKENMTCGAELIERRLGDENIKVISIVTSAFHIMRSMMLARYYLPDHYIIHAVPARPPFDTPDEWFKDEYRKTRVMCELAHLRKCILAGIGEDIEF